MSREAPFFYGISEKRICELIFSNPPLLETTLPLDVDTTLKLMVLYHQSKDQQHALKVLRSLFHIPLSTHENKETLWRQIKQNFEFSMEFLYQLNLIDSEGRPIGLSGLVTHCAEISPSNFALVYLIQSGSLAHILKSYDHTSASYSVSIDDLKLSQKISRIELFSLLSYLILRKPSYNKHGLPAFAPNIWQALDNYNQHVRILHNKLLGTQTDIVCPLVDLIPEAEVNPFIVEFYRSGHPPQYLSKTYGISESEVYYSIREFALIVRKISTAIQHIVIDPENALMLLMYDISMELWKMYENLKN